MGSRLLGVTLCILASTTLQVQSLTPTAKAPTIAELQAKVKTLEDDNARLKRDYEQLLTNCQNQHTESVDRAAAALKDAEINRQNRIEQLRQQQQLEQDLWRVVSVDYAVTETNSVFTRFAWKVVISNGLDRTQAFDLKVEFLDKNGFVIDTDREYNQTIAAYDQRTINGSALIQMPGAVNVASVQAIATRRK